MVGQETAAVRKIQRQRPRLPHTKIRVALHGEQSPAYALQRG
jgi:hypothetical protein